MFIIVIWKSAELTSKGTPGKAYPVRIFVLGGGLAVSSARDSNKRSDSQTRIPEDLGGSCLCHAILSKHRKED